jgi:hypothetical protein
MSIQLKKTLMIPKSSSKAANPTTDDTMAKENGQTLIYKTLLYFVYASNAVALCTRTRPLLP